jgi:hypothetical protein
LSFVWISFTIKQKSMVALYLRKKKYGSGQGTFLAHLETRMNPFYKIFYIIWFLSLWHIHAWWTDFNLMWQLWTITWCQIANSRKRSGAYECLILRILIVWTSETIFLCDSDISRTTIWHITKLFLSDSVSVPMNLANLLYIRG